MKKLIAMLLVLTMVLSFAAWAKQDTVTPTVAAVTTAAADPTPAAETEASDPAPVVTAMSHADYVAADNETEVVVETYVQAHQSWWDNKVTVYCQSPDGAYFLYELACSEEDAAKLVPGTKIRVTGFKGEWSGEVEIMDGTFEFVEDGDTYIAEALDVTDLLGTDELIDHQNEFVSFTGLTVERICFLHRPDRCSQHRRQRQRGCLPVQLGRLRREGQRPVLQRHRERPDLQLLRGVLPVRSGHRGVSGC